MDWRVLKKTKKSLISSLKDHKMFNFFVLFSSQKIKEKDEAENVDVITSLLWFIFV